MRLTPPLLSTSEVRYSPLGLRQLLLRSLQIPTIENLAVTLDQFDSFDLTNNAISNLSNFPPLKRLSELLLATNVITTIASDFATKLPALDTLVLTSNNLTSLSSLIPLFTCTNLTHLTLHGNPVVTRPYYRLLCLVHIPSLKVLDFVKVTQKEKDTADRFVKSKAYKDLVADVFKGQESAAKQGDGAGEFDSEFVAGSLAASAGATTAAIRTQFTAAEKESIKEMIKNASTPAAIDRIQEFVARGVMPTGAAVAPVAAPAAAPAAAPMAAPVAAPVVAPSPEKKGKRGRSESNASVAESVGSKSSRSGAKKVRKESVASVASAASEGSGAPAGGYAKLTVPKLKAELTKRGLEVPKGTKAVLVKALEADDAK